jgi:hypothetical protein
VEAPRIVDAAPLRLGKIVHAGPYVPGDRGDAMKRMRQVEKSLKDDSIKPVNRKDKDVVAKLVKEAEAEIRERLLPQNHMDKGPVGALGHFQKNEGSVGMVEDILTWKRARLALDPDNTDPDHLNVDYLRPVSWAGAPSYRTDNLTKTTMGMTPAAKENWPLGEPTTSTAFKQAQLAEARRIVEEAQAEEADATRRAETGRRLTEARSKARAAREAEAAPAEVATDDDQ